MHHPGGVRGCGQMDDVGMFISKIRPNGITFDAENRRMLKVIAVTLAIVMAIIVAFSIRAIL